MGATEVPEVATTAMEAEAAPEVAEEVLAEVVEEVMAEVVLVTEAVLHRPGEGKAIKTLTPFRCQCLSCCLTASYDILPCFSWCTSTLFTTFYHAERFKTLRETLERMRESRKRL